MDNKQATQDRAIRQPVSKTVALEVADTGNRTANAVLLFNQWLQYCQDRAGLSPNGIERLVTVFKDDSKKESEP